MSAAGKGSMEQAQQGKGEQRQVPWPDRWRRWKEGYYRCVDRGTATGIATLGVLGAFILLKNAPAVLVGLFTGDAEVSRTFLGYVVICAIAWLQWRHRDRIYPQLRRDAPRRAAVAAGRGGPGQPPV